MTVQAVNRFLCDEMLGQLCRYLRAAGYDTVLAKGGEADAALLRQCREEGRHFLTQDVLVREHKAARGVALVLPHGKLDVLARQVGEYYGLDWLGHAFTRCLVDNSPLVAADDAARARVPADAASSTDPVCHCPVCGRVYWRGSHYKRMRARLAAWQGERPSRPV